jgi:hypothetical protein
MQIPLPWERLFWTRRTLVPWRALYALTDFRLVCVRRGRTTEIVLQDIGDVDRIRSWPDRLLGTSTIVVSPRDPRHAAIIIARVRQGQQLAALIELLAGDPHATLDAGAIRAALAWDPHSGGAASPRWRGPAAALAAVVVGIFAVTAGLHSSSAAIVYSPNDAIAPNGVKRDRADIVRFMEISVMPWAREVLGPLKGGPDKIACRTCHGPSSAEGEWRMPAVGALPEPQVRLLGWEIYSAGMDAQMRNAIYGYVAESENQARAAYMRRVVMPGMARLLGRPPYDFTRSYEYNRTRLAFGCYHCHRVK